MFNLSKMFITIFGVGFSPIASGTVGTFISILMIFALIQYVSFFYFIIIFILIFLISIFSINLYCKKTKKHDASEIIIDEFLGVYFIMIFYDYIKIHNDLITLISIFFIFRFFDIFKPFPANWIDKKILNSSGIILDDIMAGIYSLISLIIINEIF
jgi:phosphatidylglycerophosphatase A